MKFLSFAVAILIGTACNISGRNMFPSKPSGTAFTGGEAFYRTILMAGSRERDSLALREILAGNFPKFIRKFAAVHSSVTDSLGRTHTAVFYVSPDYLSVGSDGDFARVPLTPMAGQRIADSFNCVLPTPKMVDLIYSQARLKLAPVPMYIFRDSSVTMWQHHLIIEGQRKNRKGLIAGIKKDVVTSMRLMEPSQRSKVAIYGWHLPGGKPIQPLYTGHANWYTDYSHGVRLLYRKIKINGKMMDYKDVITHPLYHRLLTDEEAGFSRYSY
jgi:hypothetical protein